MINDSRQIADKVDITEKLYRYCRAVDRLDHALGYSIWNEGSTADYGELYIGSGPGVIDLICEQHRHLLCHSHQLSNVLIQLDGDRAASESYVTANLRARGDGGLIQMTIWARYVDRWSRPGGRWGIDKRQVIIDFDEVRPVTPLSQVDGPGRRDSSDPSVPVLDALPSSLR